MTEVETRVRSIVDAYASKFPNTRWHLEDPEKRGITYQHIRHWTAETYRQLHQPTDNEWRFMHREVTAAVQAVVQEIVGREMSN